MNYSALIDRYMAEWPVVSGGKGDGTVKKEEGAQFNFNNTLQQAFGSQFGRQSATFSSLTSQMQNNMLNPQGFGATGLAALRTGATENAAKATANAQQATNLGIAAKGGSALPSGVNAQLTAQNNVAGGALDANSQNQISVADQELKNQNYWKSADELNNVASMENPNAYAGSANGGSGALAGLSDAYSNSQNAGAWNHFTNSFASAAGNTLGGGNAGKGGGSGAAGFFGG